MKQIRILSIGDDSLRVAMSYLPKIAKCDSVSIVSGILYNEELTAESMLQKIRSDSEDFTFVYNNEGSVRFNTIENFSVSKAFDWFDWDYVVIPQQNNCSDYACIQDLCCCIRDISPKTSIVINIDDVKNNTSGADSVLTFFVSDVSADAEKEIAESGYIADVYSGRVKDFLSACVLYEMLTGNNVAKNKYRLPFVESEITEIIKNVVHRYYAKG